ncbi:hypothetical protein, partial [Azonexus sp.]|uniref:hypothetical protein n=1 Tax=Azonexus sp. TaxID=1872668 RepID=UPI0035AF11F7
SLRASCTNRTARSLTSGEYLFVLLMAPFSQVTEPPQFPGRFTEAAGREFSEPYPTLRSVGTDLFKKDEGAEAETKIKDALTALEPAFKTIMAMEGTLGNDITPGLRKAENWITTYQNFRVLAPGLFSSFMDIMGVVREGGEFKDAWGAFVAGIKEAKNIMQDKRDDSYMMQRAELFGSADAGSFSSAVGQHSTSVYMSGKAKEWSDNPVPVGKYLSDCSLTLSDARFGGFMQKA